MKRPVDTIVDGISILSAEAVVEMTGRVAIDDEGVDSLTSELLHICRSVTEDSPLAMVFVEGSDHLVRYANPAFCRLAHIEREALMGRPFAEAIPEGTQNDAIRLLDRVYQTREAENIAEQEHAHSGLLPVYWSYAVWPTSFSERQADGIMIQVTDTTEAAISRLQAVEMNQALILSDVRQHELAETVHNLNLELRHSIRETHHRVKNNLQVVAALVDIEPQSLALSPALLRIKQHVSALANIHELLTKQDHAEPDSARIPADVVLANLLVMLQQTYTDHRIHADVDTLDLTSKRSAALALLVNECVNNAVKHGAGDVDVSLQVLDGIARLQIRDHGLGFPSSFDPVASANTGLDLISVAARWDLQGEIIFGNASGGGARITVTFPVDVPAPSGIRQTDA